MKDAGNTIWITGGGSGVGRALAQRFHDLGNEVIVTGRRREALDATIAGRKGYVIDARSKHRLGANSSGNQLLSGFPASIFVSEIRQYELATVEVSLFDVKTGNMVWSTITQTFNPSSVRQEAPRFANLIIEQLAARGLISEAR